MTFIRFLGMGWFAFFAFAGGTFAQEYNCKNPGYQQEMNYCAYQDFLAADVLLNEEYQRAVAFAKRLDGNVPDDLLGAESSLRQAQRDWVAFRDSACTAEGFVARGGTMESLLVSGCKAVLTRQRTKSLRGYVAMGS